MRLFDYDAFTSLTRFMERTTPWTMIDVGANEGRTAKRLLEEFPNASIYAFEPSPSIYPELEKFAQQEKSVKPIQLAAGSRAGSVDFHITKNHWCSSVLAPTALGKAYYGDWYDVTRTVKVQMVTLDDWAKASGVQHVDFLKVDAQGYDLEVLKGAQSLLKKGGIQAINCEFQFAPEYEGCASFSQIDQFLVSCGFALHQLHEAWSKGNEEQTSYGDGLWVRADILKSLRGKAALTDRSAKGRVRTAIKECVDRGLKRVALYGAGQHTRRVMPHLADTAGAVAAIIDDSPSLAGTSLEGKPVISASEAMRQRIDAVILSSDMHEGKLWQITKPFRDAGIDVIPLYSRYTDAA